MARIIAYVDGFNLYYGLRSKAGGASSGSTFTAWLRICCNRASGCWGCITSPLASGRGPETRIPRRRQGTYLEALETLPGVRLHYGHYLAKTRRCPRCQATWETFEEKMTDVNIAVELLGSAQDDAFDTAILVSGDSDLTRPVQAIQTRYPTKRGVVAFPPDRTSSQLRDAASAGFVIGRKKLLESQLPDRVINRDGHVPDSPAGMEVSAASLVRARERFIDVAPALDAINRASAREKSIRHGHPSTLHLWCAPAARVEWLASAPRAEPESARTRPARLEQLDT